MSCMGLSKLTQTHRSWWIDTDNRQSIHMDLVVDEIGHDHLTDSDGVDDGKVTKLLLML